MRTLALCVLLATPLAALAAGDEGAPPESFKLTYERNSFDPGQGINALTVTYAKGRARLSIALTEQGHPRSVQVDPWPDAPALWKQVEAAKLFDFKPQEGAATPHFGEVKLALEAVTKAGKRETRLAWRAPLKNDGQVWALIDYLDRLMTAPPPEASPAPSPSSSTR